MTTSLVIFYLQMHHANFLFFITYNFSTSYNLFYANLTKTSLHITPLARWVTHMIFLMLIAKLHNICKVVGFTHRTLIVFKTCRQPSERKALNRLHDFVHANFYLVTVLFFYFISCPESHDELDVTWTADSCSV